MWNVRTDLAVEAKEIWSESAQTQTELSGVRAQDKTVSGFNITTVEILDENGAQQLGKPVGKYVTVELDSFIKREDESFEKGVRALADEISGMLGLIASDRVLVIGLGNDAITADAIGPQTMKNTMVTNHLVEKMPDEFGAWRRVFAMESGVLGTTGIETADLIRAVTEKIRPDRVVVVDALATRRLARICRTVQLADTGIVPGSGVGNSRAAINRETLGVPVTAIGVPTVVDAGTLVADLTEQAGLPDVDPAVLGLVGGDMVVTPKEIDQNVSDISKFVGYAINLALHTGLTVDDVNMFIS